MAVMSCAAKENRERKEQGETEKKERTMGIFDSSLLLLRPPSLSLSRPPALPSLTPMVSVTRSQLGSRLKRPSKDELVDVTLPWERFFK